MVSASVSKIRIQSLIFSLSGRYSWLYWSFSYDKIIWLNHSNIQRKNHRRWTSNYFLFCQTVDLLCFRACGGKNIRTVAENKSSFWFYAIYSPKMILESTCVVVVSPHLNCYATKLSVLEYQDNDRLCEIFTGKCYINEWNYHSS